MRLKSPPTPNFEEGKKIKSIIKYPQFWGQGAEDLGGLSGDCSQYFRLFHGNDSDNAANHQQATENHCPKTMVTVNDGATVTLEFN